MNSKIRYFVPKPSFQRNFNAKIPIQVYSERNFKILKSSHINNFTIRRFFSTKEISNINHLKEKETCNHHNDTCNDAFQHCCQNQKNFESVKEVVEPKIIIENINSVTTPITMSSSVISQKNGSSVPFVEQPLEPITDADIYERITPEKLHESFTIVRNEVRKHHPEFFLMGLYYPIEHINAYYTLQAMNLSLMSKHNPDDTNASLLKFNWWKDNIHQAIRKPPLDVPLLICLHAICKKYNLNSSHFRQLFKWRVYWKF